MHNYFGHHKNWTRIIPTVGAEASIIEDALEDPAYFTSINVSGGISSNLVSTVAGQVYEKLCGDIWKIFFTSTSAGQVYNFISSVGMVVRSKQPVIAMTKVFNGDAIWVTKDFVGKSFAFSAIRSNPQTLLVSALAEGADVTLTHSSGTEQVEVCPNSTEGIQWSVYGNYIVNSTANIIPFHYSNGGTDSKPLQPVSKALYGYASGSARITPTTNGTNWTHKRADGVVQNGVSNISSNTTITGGGSRMNGRASLVEANNPISVASYADGDGGNATSFISSNLFKDTFRPAFNLDYLAIVSDVAGQVQRTDTGQTINVTGTNGIFGGYLPNGSNIPQGTEFIGVDGFKFGVFTQANTNVGGASNDDETFHLGYNQEDLI